MRRLRATLVTLAVLLSLAGAPRLADAGCWCDLRVLSAGGAAFCYTSWEGWRGTPHGGGTQICDGDPAACWADYYSNGFFEYLGPNRTEVWHNLTTVSPNGPSCAPLATPAATVWKPPALGLHLHERAQELRAMLVQTRGQMQYFCFQALPDLRARNMCVILQRLILALTAQLVIATNMALDPPNGDYATSQAACGQGGGPPLTPAEVTVDGLAALTPAQLAAWNDWERRSYDAVNAACQAHGAWERASGAVLAAQAGDPLAAPWVGRQGAAFDAAMAAARAGAASERAARPGAFAPFAPTAAPASCPPSAARLMVDAVALGADPEQAAGAAALAGPCVPAATWPAFALADLDAGAALDAALAAVSLADTVCAADAAYCAPTLAASPSPLPFGPVLVGSASALLSVTVQNTGTADLVIGAITRGGANPGEFKKAAANDLCSGVTLAPTATCTVGLKFAPLATGSRSATLGIPSNAPPVAVALSGTGVGVPAIQVTPASLAFPPTVVGAHPSSAQVVTITNTGTAPLLLGGLSLVGARAADYKMAAALDHCSLATLQPAQACTVGIRFKPLAAGPRVPARLRVPNNATADPIKVPFTGTGL